jgi:hypothetical protein
MARCNGSCEAAGAPERLLSRGSSSLRPAQRVAHGLLGNGTGPPRHTCPTQAPHNCAPPTPAVQPADTCAFSIAARPWPHASVLARLWVQAVQARHRRLRRRGPALLRQAAVRHNRQQPRCHAPPIARRHAAHQTLYGSGVRVGRRGGLVRRRGRLEVLGEAVCDVREQRCVLAEDG